MKPIEIIHQLESNRLVFQSLLSGRNKEEYTFKPDNESWSILEILCHLIDEEREDFKTRIRNTLDTPLKQPPAIDPQGWVESRNYAQQVYIERLEAFLTERRQSVKWLKSLDTPDWKNKYQHPEAGEMTAFSLLANWLAHDYHHIRQINRRLYEYLKKKSNVSLIYAGDW